MIYHHLLEEGYMDSAKALEKESRFALCHFEACDNVNLETVLMEYESYYFIKFQIYPKLTKKLAEQGRHHPVTHSQESTPSRNTVKKTESKLTGRDNSKSSVSLQTTERLLKPMSAFIGMNSDMRERAAVISRDIYLHNPNVRWDDIIGLEDAKRLVKEAVIYPIKYPQLFTGILSPWKGLLLYGPPGLTFLFSLCIIQMNILIVRKLYNFLLLYGFLYNHSNLRLEKRILVGLPSAPARQAMISHWLPPVSNTGGVELRMELNYESLCPNRQTVLLRQLYQYVHVLIFQETGETGGSDIRLVCKETAMRLVRKNFKNFENHIEGQSNMPVIELETVTTADFLEVIAHTKPSARCLMERYSAWEKEYESV
uniref:Katanin p60 subunit A-like 2 n=1 Tax=Sinocyclocheilus anshuiensis TaxID=1608454 RepID=A0A671T5T5_9TELE